MANVIKNLWDKVTIYCENHEAPEEMRMLTNTEMIKTPYMACTHEHPCPNRLNMDDYQGICLKLMDLIKQILSYNVFFYSYSISSIIILLASIKPNYSHYLF